MIFIFLVVFLFLPLTKFFFNRRIPVLVLLLDPPLVTLRLGSTLSPDDIKEGDDVYFECHVQSNPQWRKLLWLHNVSIFSLGFVCMFS